MFGSDSLRAAAAAAGDAATGALTYGELDVAAFMRSMESARKAAAVAGLRRFSDVGCGSGKLVLMAAEQCGFDECLGVEIAAAVVRQGVCAMQRAGIDVAEQVWAPRGAGGGGGGTRIRMVAADALERTEWADSDVVFMHALCFPAALMRRLCSVMAESMPVGAVLVTSKQPPADCADRVFELVESLDQDDECEDDGSWSFFSSEQDWSRMPLWVYRRRG